MTVKGPDSCVHGISNDDFKMVKTETVKKKLFYLCYNEHLLIRRRKDFLVRRMKLAKHFIRTNVEPE